MKNYLLLENILEIEDLHIIAIPEKTLIHQNIKPEKNDIIQIKEDMFSQNYIIRGKITNIYDEEIKNDDELTNFSTEFISLIKNNVHDNLDQELRPIFDKLNLDTDKILANYLEKISNYKLINGNIYKLINKNASNTKFAFTKKTDQLNIMNNKIYFNNEILQQSFNLKKQMFFNGITKIKRVGTCELSMKILSPYFTNEINSNIRNTENRKITFLKNTINEKMIWYQNN